MWEAVGLVCFLHLWSKTCVIWRDPDNPHLTFEACDRATDVWLETINARFSGFGRVTVTVACVETAQES